jgi:toxin CptA
VKTPPAVQFEYRASRVLMALLIAVAVLALAALWLSALPRWWRGGAAALVVVYAGSHLVKLWRPRIRTVHWRGDGGVDVVLNAARDDGTTETLGAVDAARVIGPLLVLTVRWPPREREHLWILPDNLDADARRRLRMRLAADTRADLASEHADTR